MINLITTFWNARDRPNVVLFHKDDLKSDLEGDAAARRYLASRFPRRWSELVDADVRGMRVSADRIAPAIHVRSGRQPEFFHGGAGRRLLDDDGLRRYAGSPS
jgi:hypothetical protein